MGLGQLSRVIILETLHDNMAAAAQALADKIYVKEGKVEHSLTMRPGTTVQQLKDALASKIQLDAAYFNIINKGKTLDDGTATLSSVKVRYGAKLVMIKTEEFHTDKPQLLLVSPIQRCTAGRT